MHILSVFVVLIYALDLYGCWGPKESCWVHSVPHHVLQACREEEFHILVMKTESLRVTINEGGLIKDRNESGQSKPCGTLLSSPSVTALVQSTINAMSTTCLRDGVNK